MNSSAPCCACPCPSASSTCRLRPPRRVLVCGAGRKVVGRVGRGGEQCLNNGAANAASPMRAEPRTSRSGTAWGDQGLADDQHASQPGDHAGDSAMEAAGLGVWPRVDRPADFPAGRGGRASVLYRASVADRRLGAVAHHPFSGSGRSARPLVFRALTRRRGPRGRRSRRFATARPGRGALCHLG